MRFGSDGYPLVIVSHRGQEFLETTINSIAQYATGITEVIVVDDSGDTLHRDWLDSHRYQYSVVAHENAGYLEAMKRTWGVAREAADFAGVDKVLLWEEDFLLTKPLQVASMAAVMDANPKVANLNLQRQPVYRVERRWGYMESHQRRGYNVRKALADNVPWVARKKPFTTNPGLIRRDVLDIDWPTREEADAVQSGAEPAMSLRLEALDYHFGWYGQWNTPHTQHIGADHKTGIGY